MVNHGLPIMPPPRPRRHAYRDYDDHYDDEDGYAFHDYDGYGEYDRFLRDAPITFSRSISSNGEEDELEKLWPTPSSDSSGVDGEMTLLV